MKHGSFILIYALAVIFAMTSCYEQKIVAETIPEWYRGSSVISDSGTVDMQAIDAGKIDFVYLVSTEVLSSKDDKGNAVYQATLSKEDRTTIDSELDFVMNTFCKGDFNYFAPYYHQYTFEAAVLPKDQYNEVYAKVKSEVNDILEYYLNNINDGRKFALVGFSQGAMLVIDALKHFSKDQLQNMVGAYSIGYGINDDDVKCENIIPATGETGFGHTISFNSVMTPEATWAFVHNNAKYAINPVNWKTDSTPASFDFDNGTVTATLDGKIHELIVEVPDKTPYHEFMNANPAYKMAGVSADCMHRWDLLFYTQMIHDNILKRAANK